MRECSNATFVHLLRAHLNMRRNDDDDDDSKQTQDIIRKEHRTRGGGLRVRLLLLLLDTATLCATRGRRRPPIVFADCRTRQELTLTTRTRATRLYARALVHAMAKTRSAATN